MKRVTGDQWKVFTVGLNVFYNNPVPSTTLQNHTFYFEFNSNKTTYTRQIYRDEYKISCDLRLSPKAKVGKLAAEERELKVKSLYNNVLILPLPGLLAIKESGLHNKVAKNVVPKPFKKAYPAPSKDVTDQEKRRKSTKGKKATLREKAKEDHIKNYNKQRKVENTSLDESANEGSLAENTNDNKEYQVESIDILMKMLVN